MVGKSNLVYEQYLQSLQSICVFNFLWQLSDESITLRIICRLSVFFYISFRIYICSSPKNEKNSFAILSVISLGCTILLPCSDQNPLSYPFPLYLPVHFDMTVPLYPICSLIPDSPIADCSTASAISSHSLLDHAFVIPPFPSLSIHLKYSFHFPPQFSTEF